MKTQFLKWSFFIFLSFSYVYAGQNKSSMLQDLSTIKGIFDNSYAPIEWKKENDKWDLEGEYQKAVLAITQDKDLSLKDYQQLLRKFIDSSMDYHVDIVFYSTERAWLPFRVKTVDCHTYVDWMDPLRLSKESLSLRVGDEILEFDGKPIVQALEEVHQIRSKNSNRLTEIALTDENLTKRVGASGDIIPKGPITVTFRSGLDGKVKSNQLIWEHFPELIKTPPNLMQTIPSFLNHEKEKKGLFASQYSLYNEALAAFADGEEDDEGLGSRTSFVPTLGKPIWVWNGKLDDEEEEAEDLLSDLMGKSSSMWNAYIYENVEGRKIGYIRIPHYLGDDKDLELFGQIIGYLEKETEGLVIDQVNNIGGHVEYSYNIAAMLTSDFLKTPKHRLKITQKDIYDAIGMIDRFDNLLKNAGNSSLFEKLLGKKEEEIDYQKILFQKYFYQFLTEEWSAGRNFTMPTYLDGADIINPNPQVHYTKPILMLINELDFSGGDFIPAIFQDNKRATLFGSQTAGAGGFIRSSKFTNKHGIKSVGYTASLAERETLEKIESIGVSPDIEYKITASDIQNRYVNYAIKVNEAIAALLPPPEEKILLIESSDDWANQYFDEEEAEQSSDEPKIVVLEDDLPKIEEVNQEEQESPKVEVSEVVEDAPKILNEDELNR